MCILLYQFCVDGMVHFLDITYMKPTSFSANVISIPIRLFSMSGPFAQYSFNPILHGIFQALSSTPVTSASCCVLYRCHGLEQKNLIFKNLLG